MIAYLAGLPPIRLHDLRHGAATLRAPDIAAWLRGVAGLLIWLFLSLFLCAWACFRVTFPQNR